MISSSLTEGKKRLCVCDWSGAVEVLEREWPGIDAHDGSVAQLEAGASLAAALRGRAGSPHTPDGRRSVQLLREVVAADRRRGFRYFGVYSARATYFSAEAVWFDAAQARALDPAEGLRLVDDGLNLFRDFPFPKPVGAGLWVERARCLAALGRPEDAREAAATALRAERAGATASPASISLDLRFRAEAEQLLA